MLNRFNFTYGPEDGNGNGGGTGTGTTLDLTNLNEEAINALLENEAIKSIVAKRIQSAEDKVRTEKAKALKDKDDAAKTEMEKIREQLALLESERTENIKTSVIEAMGLDLKARKFITGTTKEEMEASANELKSWYSERETKAIEEKLKAHGTDQTQTKGKGGKVDMSKLSYSERAELFRTNPELFQ